MDDLTQAESRVTLSAIVAQCDKALSDRLAKRFSTRESLKALQRRAEDLLKREDGRDFAEEFEKVFVTADAVFDALIGELGGMAEEKPTEH